MSRHDGCQAVPHPVPALGIEGDPRSVAVGGGVRRQAVGAHELIFGEHGTGSGALLELVARRISDLRRDARLRGFGVTCRHRTGEHRVWQLFALPAPVPLSAPAGWRDHERAQRERVLAEAEGVTTILAWAPRVPFETWVLPSTGIARFEASGPDVRAAVARAAEGALRWIERELRGAPVDLVWVDGEPWRIEIVPRLAEPTAVEVATGIPIHGVFPEAAAEWLRGVSDGSDGSDVSNVSDGVNR